MNSPERYCLYTETVPLQSPIWFVLDLATAGAATITALLCGAAYEDTLPEIALVLATLLYAYALKSLSSVYIELVSLKLTITVTNSDLILSQPLYWRRRISLTDITDTIPRTEKRSERRWLRLVVLRVERLGNPTSNFVRTSVRVTVRNGGTIAFATRNPETVADLLRREAERAFRSETLALVEKHRLEKQA